MAWYRKLHWQIIIGLILGLLYGLLAAIMKWGWFTSDFIAPVGTIFLNLLKLIAVPLVLASLITGVASLSDISKLSRIGTKTLVLYISTTFVALLIGLLLVNVLRPGDAVPPEMRSKLEQSYEADSQGRTALAHESQNRGPLQVVVDIVPDNLFSAFSNNRNMLQVVFFAIFAGIGLIMIPKERSKPLIAFFEGLNALVIKLIDIIMLMAPYGVFALIADTINSVARDNLGEIFELLGALGYYCIAVLAGLAIHTLVVYPAYLKIMTGLPIGSFFKGLTPAQLVAFSTSSSGATLPVTMECAEQNLGVSEEVSSFVLPLGATVNMDGTAIYQAIAAVFIAQTIGMDLGFAAQATIVLTALLASIGTAAVPSAGIIMLVIILETVNVPGQGIALILGVDRILDMFRTVTNVTGDAMVATVVAHSESSVDREVFETTN